MLKLSKGRIAIEFCGSFLVVFAGSWGFMEPAGIQPGFRLWMSLIIFSIVISIFYSMLRLWSTRPKLEFAMTNNIIQLKELIANRKEVRIFASGSETYRTALLSALSNCEIKSKLSIKVLIRHDGTDIRRLNIQKAQDKWKDIDNKYNTNTEIRTYSSTVFLRGFIFDAEKALLGWYLVAEKTEGQDIPAILLSDNNDNSRIIIEFAKRTFDEVFSKAPNE